MQFVPQLLQLKETANNQPGPYSMRNRDCADPVTDVQPANAKSSTEDTSTGTPKSEDHNTIPSVTNRPEYRPTEVSSDINSNEHNNVEQQ